MINLADKGETEKPIKIGVNFPKDMKDELIALLKEFKEIFAWSYQDMPGLDTEIVFHRILVKFECLPMWQALRRMKSKIILKNQRRSRKAVESQFSYCHSLLRLDCQHCSLAKERSESTHVHRL